MSGSVPKSEAVRSGRRRIPVPLTAHPRRRSGLCLIASFVRWHGGPCCKVRINHRGWQCGEAGEKWGMEEERVFKVPFLKYYVGLGFPRWH